MGASILGTMSGRHIKSLESPSGKCGFLPTFLWIHGVGINARQEERLLAHTADGMAQLNVSEVRVVSRAVPTPHDSSSSSPELLIHTPSRGFDGGHTTHTTARS